MYFLVVSSRPGYQALFKRAEEPFYWLEQNVTDVVSCKFVGASILCTWYMYMYEKCVSPQDRVPSNDSEFFGELP